MKKITTTGRGIYRHIETEIVSSKDAPEVQDKALCRLSQEASDKRLSDYLDRCEAWAEAVVDGDPNELYQSRLTLRPDQGFAVELWWDVRRLRRTLETGKPSDIALNAIAVESSRRCLEATDWKQGRNTKSGVDARQGRVELRAQRRDALHSIIKRKKLSMPLTKPDKKAVIEKFEQTHPKLKADPRTYRRDFKALERQILRKS